MSAGADIPIGARVQVKAGVGRVRWSGLNPPFSPTGRWVGIELDSPGGKNNGTVNGESYFVCEPNHGVFVRASQVTVLAAPRAPRPSVAGVGSAATSRASTPGRPRPSVAPSTTPSRTTSRSSATGPSTPPRAGSSSTATVRARMAPRPSLARPTPGVAARRQSINATSASPAPGARQPITPSARRASTISQASATSTRGPTPSTASSSAMGQLRAAISSTTSPVSDADLMPPPPVPATARRESTLPAPQFPRAGKTSLSVPPSPRRESLLPSSPRGIPAPRAVSASPRAVAATYREAPSPLPEQAAPPESPSRLRPATPSETDEAASLSASRSTVIPPSPSRLRAATPTEPRDATALSASQSTAVPASPRRLRAATPSDTGNAVPSASRAAAVPPSPRQSRTALSIRSASPNPEMAATMHAQKRELDELRIKLRLLEARRAEDQERLKGLEKKASEGDQLAAIRAKLQVKFQEQQAALVNSQRLARDLQSENVHLETRAQDAMDQLEMATLDREVAEEKAEAAEAELERLNEKLQDLELEVAVLKEENEEYEKPVVGLDSERSSLAFVQLEKHNERLKEALIRLRDVSTDAEKEHRSKIHDLEKELSAHEDLGSRLELAEAKLSSSEEQVEDLKQQLDDALGAEDLLEELTERNLQMSERIEEMRVAIEDLESLKELNDELEETHIETERQLEEEVDVLTIKLREENARSSDLEAVVVDMEATINQFRELVANLQSEIDSLRVQQATQEYETATASKESQALLNLNLKLQSSAVKTQSKTIDLELKRLEAAQLAEHLRIVQLYLPDPYLESEVDSTTAILFFYRVASKVDMLVNVISNLHGLPNALQNTTSDVLVGVCELRGKLRSFAMLNRRFAAVMRRAESDDYVNFGKVVGELVGVEPKVDGWVSMVKADEFSEGDCARELDSLIAQFNHLAEVMFNYPSLDASEQQLALAFSLEDDLDNFAAAIGFVGHAVQSLVKDGDVEIVVGESTLEEDVYEPVQRILNQVRAVKTPAGKLVNVIEEAVAGQFALLPEFTTSLVSLQSSVADAVDMAIQLAQRIGAHIASIRSSKEPLKLSDIDKFLAEVTAQSDADTPPWDVISSFVTRLGTELGENVPKFRNASKSGQIVSLDVPPPWLARVAAIKEAASYNAEAERKVTRLTEELKDMMREIKLRDVNLEESGVKIETLERRLEGSRKQADTILDLENELSKGKKQEKVYEEAIEQLQAEMDAAEAEIARVKRNLPAGVGEGDVPLFNASASTADAAQLAEQVENLRAAIRFLRSENALLKSKDLYADVKMLPVLRPLRTISPVPELVPSGEDSDADSDGPATPKRIIVTRPDARHALNTESKILFREIASFAARPAIVDITGLGANGPAWRSRKNAPEIQVWRITKERQRLESRVGDLAQRVAALRR